MYWSNDVLGHWSNGASGPRRWPWQPNPNPNPTLTLTLAVISRACDEGHGVHKANALAVLDAVAPLVVAEAGVGGRPTA